MRVRRQAAFLDELNPLVRIHRKIEHRCEFSFQAGKTWAQQRVFFRVGPLQPVGIPVEKKHFDRRGIWGDQPDLCTPLLAYSSSFLPRSCNNVENDRISISRKGGPSTCVFLICFGSHTTRISGALHCLEKRVQFSKEVRQDSPVPFLRTWRHCICPPINDLPARVIVPDLNGHPARGGNLLISLDRPMFETCRSREHRSRDHLQQELFVFVFLVEHSRFSSCWFS